jgi:hypothetical protein
VLCIASNKRIKVLRGVRVPSALLTIKQQIKSFKQANTMKSENKILLAVSTFCAIFGAAGVTATNEKSYVAMLTLSILGAFLSTLENK